ncbi:sodium/proline symporter PutP [Pseudalkalibacillus salsuginis]|uniref:sodium/proline symporter PutP n=1 Tax=Pseudalkalibacillus salsuginis TaxID=2910972 RepID=UPI001F1B11A6|nr:sodium/proline symporter PutP [Pseudalkalibacillus salsuginis]MCF6411465.1 sodium/proline symporter PutP [Pseudalkalibacillus salsuginis]
MGIDTPTLITFIIYLVVMLAIGVISYRLTSNLSDYVLGGRSLTPGVAALSAGASDMSGWLLLGLPGAVYAGGMNAAWIGIGLSIGAYLNWQFVAKRLRQYTEVSNDSITIPDYFENRFRDNSKILRVMSAIVILFFFTVYTASGLVGGAKLFQSSFNMPYTAALWIGAAVIISYTFLGGFLAVSWTDFIQGILMFLALIIVPIVAVNKVGGWNETINQVGAVDAGFVDIMAGMGGVTGFLAIISSLAWGLGYFGQPHILTRFMAVKSSQDIPKARMIGMTWMVVSLFGAIFTGLAGIAYFADNPLEGAATETVFILFTQVLFNPWVSGVLLAAILAAIMSTVDSQLLVSSSALAEDFYKALLRKNASEKELVWIGRFAVIGIALIAGLIASNPESRVLELVSYAWAGFGAAFGPVIILSLFWRRMTRNSAIAGILVGAVTVVLWKTLSTPPAGAEQTEAVIPFALYEIIPGFILATIAIIIVSLMGKGPKQEVKDEFTEAVE